MMYKYVSLVTQKMYYWIWEVHNTVLIGAILTKWLQILGSPPPVKRGRSVSFPFDFGWMCGGFDQQLVTMCSHRTCTARSEKAERLWCLLATLTLGSWLHTWRPTARRPPFWEVTCRCSRGQSRLCSQPAGSTRLRPWDSAVSNLQPSWPSGTAALPMCLTAIVWGTPRRTACLSHSQISGPQSHKKK